MYVFDLDGTLLDSNGIWLDIDIAFLGRHGIDPVPPDYTEYVTHHSSPEAAAYTRKRFDLGISSEEIMASWREMAREAYGGTLRLKPGAKPLLMSLRGTGEKMAVLTSCMPDLCWAALERHGIGELFSGVLTTAELGLEKKDPALYRRAAELCDTMPEACTFLDDSPLYCAAARSAGMTVVGVWDPLFSRREEEVRAASHRYVRSLEELIPAAAAPGLG